MTRIENLIDDPQLPADMQVVLYVSGEALVIAVNRRGSCELRVRIPLNSGQASVDVSADGRER